MRLNFDSSVENERIRSELKFFLELAITLLLTPITFLLVVIGKKEYKELNKPYKMLIEFFLEAKITATLVILNIVAFFTVVSLPMFNPELFEIVINNAVLKPSTVLSKPYTLLTHGFLHANLAHLFWNMFFLLVFGRILERKMGWKMLIAYFTAMIVSGIVYTAIHLSIGDDLRLVGASGAIYGLMALAMLLNPFYITFALLVPMPVMVLAWTFIAKELALVVIGVQDNIAHYAHIAGFSSVFVMFFLLHDYRKQLVKGFIVNLVSVVVLLLLRFFIAPKLFPNMF